MNFVKMAQLLVIALGFSMVLANKAEARNCNKGKPCGNSCISKNDVCHKGGFLNDSAISETAGRPSRATVSGSTTANEPSITQHRAPAVAAEPVNVPAVRQMSAKHCNKGKPCGNSCIRQDAVCRE